MPATDPKTHGGTSSRNSFECVDNSLRNPRIPPSELGKVPTVEETFACKVGIPRATKVGKLKNVPPPAIPLEMPAAMPATKMIKRRQPRGSEVASIPLILQNLGALSP